MAGRKHVLLACTGSVASIKIPIIIQQLREAEPSIEIRLVVTQNSLHFFDVESIPVEVFRDEDEWKKMKDAFFLEDGPKCPCRCGSGKWTKSMDQTIRVCKWKKMKDPVLHIELRRWADLMIICPLDANTLAKIANGLCDNLLTSIVRAWDMKCPLLFAPAMNTMMWEHVLTKRHIDTLESFGYIGIPCIAKKLACNDVGMGAMAAVDTIISKILSCLQSSKEKSICVNEGKSICVNSAETTSPESGIL